jgi:hypothetical protein
VPALICETKKEDQNNMNMDHDLTPKERADDMLLEQLLGRDASLVGQSCIIPDKRGDRGCGDTRYDRGTFGVDGILAALYLPVQPFENLHDEETALARGTLFRALDLPFMGG